MRYRYFLGFRMYPNEAVSLSVYAIRLPVCLSICMSGFCHRYIHDNRYNTCFFSFFVSFFFTSKRLFRTIIANLINNIAVFDIQAIKEKTHKNIIAEIIAWTKCHVTTIFLIWFHKFDLFYVCSNFSGNNVFGFS